MSAPPPRVVLVGPENPRNVGFVARAMLAFGVEDLAVASSPWRKAPAEAYTTGTAAAAVLDRARFVPTLAAALEGCADAAAFSRRPTALRQEESVLPRLPAGLGARGRLALVFGRESAGLTREELSLCPRLLRIPGAPGVSLNLGQAAAVALFALTAPPAEAALDPRKVRPPSSPERVLALWSLIETRLAAAPRFTPARLQRARQMLYRLRLDDEDSGLLFAVMSELARPAASRRRS